MMQNPLTNLGLLPRTINGMNSEQVAFFANKSAVALAQTVHPDRNAGEESPAISNLSSALASLENAQINNSISELHSRHRFLKERNNFLSLANQRLPEVSKLSLQVTKAAQNLLSPYSLFGRAAEIDVIFIRAIESAEKKERSNGGARQIVEALSKQLDEDLHALGPPPDDIIHEIRSEIIGGALLKKLFDKKLPQQEEEKLANIVHQAAAEDTLFIIPEDLRKELLQGIDLDFLEKKVEAETKSAWAKRVAESTLDLNYGKSANIDRARDRRDARNVDRLREIEAEWSTYRTTYRLREDGKIWRHARYIGNLLGIYYSEGIESLGWTAIARKSNVTPSFKPTSDKHIVALTSLVFNQPSLLEMAPNLSMAAPPIPPNTMLYQTPLVAVRKPNGTVQCIGRYVEVRFKPIKKTAGL